MHSVLEIEEKIRQRYRQPKGVEQFGIEPVPPELKTVRWHDIFAIIFGFALNPGSMLVGGMAVVSGLSFWGAIGAITSGILLATIAYTITATVGVDYGLPGQVSMRMVYGLRGMSERIKRRSRQAVESRRKRRPSREAPRPTNVVSRDDLCLMTPSSLSVRHLELPFIGDQVACLSHDQAARLPP